MIFLVMLFLFCVSVCNSVFVVCLYGQPVHIMSICQVDRLMLHDNQMIKFGQRLSIATSKWVNCL